MNRTLFKWVSLVVLVAAAAVPAAARAAGDADGRPLVVYCYDSFPSDWGPGPAIAEAFEAETGIVVEYRAPGDAVTVMNQLILEGDSTDADVVVGIDNSLLARVLDSGVLSPYDSPALAGVPEALVFDGTKTLLPYDYGHFAVCYDAELLETPPSSLEDLTDERFGESLVLMDPRTSTPGLGFLLWTVAVYGDEWPLYWERLRPSILTVSDGWSQAYSLFTAGEAPMVLSYGTSPVYHVMWEETDRYRAAEFEDGHPVQIEGMGISAVTDRRKDAEAFVDFMLGGTAQEALALSNIMLPVNNGVRLPEAFDSAMRPETTLALPEGLDDGKTDELIARWLDVFTR